ncbi:MAG: hypothetical protein Q8N84_01445 [bacterium]|nr:hypothetical protein [bacterium]
MSWKPVLVRVTIGIIFASLAFFLPHKLYFFDHPLFGVPYLAQALVSFAAGALAVLGIPIFLQRLWFSLAQWISGVVEKTVRKAFWELWAQRSHQLKEAKETRRLEAKKKREEKAREFASRPIFIDTSVLIDGRFIDVVKSGFVDNPLIVIDPVLQELQRVADSGDSGKRQRGRRGLEILEELKKLDHPNLEIITYEKSVEDVDKELVYLAKKEKGKIATVDFNLNKVASVSGIPVLNVNLLANALKTVVIPGEAMPVKVVQEGREDNQGVGYLEDGTMIVVEGGKSLVGREINLVVTRVIQTAAGRMIFGRPENSRPS